MTSTATPALVTDGLEFGFGPGRHLLRDVSVTVRAGELCALLGPNGAGKTTLLRCVLGLLTPSRGTVRITGTPTGELTARELARRVAYVPQSGDVVFPFTTLDVVVMGRTPHLRLTSTPSADDRRAARETLDGLGIAQLAERPFGELSGGERQLALIARALLQRAPVLVLDEPTAALDYGNATKLLGVITDLAAAGHAVLMTTHQPDHALGYADRVVLMRDGQVAADGVPSDVLTTASLSALYDTPIQIAEVALDGRAPTRVCVPLHARSGPRRPPSGGTSP